jgi:hypothetical protein
MKLALLALNKSHAVTLIHKDTASLASLNETEIENISRLNNDSIPQQVTEIKNPFNT